jgi:hypothetical protein
MITLFAIPIEFWAVFISAFALILYILNLRPTAFVEAGGQRDGGFAVTVYNPKEQPIEIITAYIEHSPKTHRPHTTQLSYHPGFWVLPKTAKTVKFNAPKFDGHVSGAKMRRIWGGIITPSPSYHLVLLHYGNDK